MGKRQAAQEDQAKNNEELGVGRASASVCRAAGRTDVSCLTMTLDHADEEHMQIPDSWGAFAEHPQLCVAGGHCGMLRAVLWNLTKTLRLDLTCGCCRA